LEIEKQHHEWMPQEIALTFTTKFPMLGLNILEIKQHLKHINYKRKQQPTYNNKISSNDFLKNNSNITIPQEKELAPRKKQIKDTNTQYISKTSHYVKLLSKVTLPNNDIESNKTMFI